MRPAEYWIDNLNLKAHPEGGYYKETYRSTETIPTLGLPSRFNAAKNFSTAIYFLLRSQDKSLFHRIKSDELWHYHYGSTLHIYILHETKVSEFKLGNNIEAGESLQVVIPANHWFGAKLVMSNTYSLSSCTVAPGFDFKDFEMAERQKLLDAFPNHSEIIIALTN
jgi:predicted cupin superfamily sugar epimerase